MTKISINSPGGGGGSLPNGSLQLENGDAMDSTLRYVTDTANTQSKLLLSDTTTKVEGTLTVDGGAVIPRIIIDADTNVARILSIRTNDLPRWALRVDGTESGSNAGSDFAIRRYNDAGAFIDAPLSINRANGRVSIIERLLLEADSTATTQSTAVIQNPTANSGIAIVPNGTGAITAAIPDGTSVGGNSRGINSVDFQTSKSAADQVASGVSSVISGGSQNRASGARSVIVGGLSNIANGNQSFVGGGHSNVSSDNYAVVAGGQSNTASSSYSTISGGQSNTASTGTHATVVGGLQNTSSGSSSVSGGYLNNVSGSASTVFGQQNTVSGNYAFAVGFQNQATNVGAVSLNLLNIASKEATLAIGTYANAYLFNGFSQASGNFSGSQKSEIQQTIVIANREDTLSAAATTVLSLDGTGVTNLIIPDGPNRSWNVNINWVAVVTAITGTATGVTVGDTFAQCLVLGFKRVLGTSSIVGSSGALFTNSDASMLTALLTPTVGASQELALTFTAPSFSGGGSITCRIVAKVELVETSWT